MKIGRHEIILEKSLVNCHVLGVDSLVLTNNRRFYAARKNHQLYETDAVAIHPHHRDLTLEVVYGKLVNVIYDYSARGLQFNEYLYTSKITGNGGSFSKIGEKRLSTVWIEVLDPKEQVDPTSFMSAYLLHTVRCIKNKPAGWLVHEGAEDPNYKSIAYSEKDLTGWTPDGLYLPMSEGYLSDLLKEMEVLS